MPTTPGGQPSPASTIAGPGSASPSIASASSITLSWIVRRSVFAASSAGRARRRVAPSASSSDERRLRGAEPTGRVDPRRELPRDRARVDLALGIDAGRLEQRGDAGARAALQPAQAERGEDPVLGGERNEVGDRAERDEIEQLANIGLAAASGSSRDRAARCAPTRRRRTPRPTDAMPRNGNVESARIRIDERRARDAARRPTAPCGDRRR